MSFGFARDFAPANVAAAETAGEVEPVDRGIGAGLRLGDGAPGCGDVEYAATSDDPRTDWQDTKAQFQEVRELVRTAHSLLREALAALKDAVAASDLERGVSEATSQNDNSDDDGNDTSDSAEPEDNTVTQ